MRSVRAIVFDFDGVVVDSEPLYEKAEKKLFAKYHICPGEEIWKRIKGLSEKIFLILLRDEYGIDVSIEELQVYSRQYLREVFARDLRYVPGFVEFFKQIKPRYKNGLVTSTSWDLLDWIFHHTAICNDFQEIVTVDDTANGKPHPEPYLLIAHRLGVQPGEMLVIEDSINGIESARAAGAFTIGFTTSLTKEDLSLANLHAKNYAELIKILASHSNLDSIRK
jgi:HAD superfamily hydrolase (TIGR01509 family)